MWYSILSRDCITNALGIPPKPYGRAGYRPVSVMRMLIAVMAGAVMALEIAVQMARLSTLEGVVGDMREDRTQMRNIIALEQRQAELERHIAFLVERINELEKKK